jgi:hypothetical protein
LINDLKEEGDKAARSPVEFPFIQENAKKAQQQVHDAYEKGTRAKKTISTTRFLDPLVVTTL